MRRITLWIVSTIGIVVLLFSYRTSLGPVATPAQLAGPGRVSNPGTTATAPPDPNALTFDGSVADTRWGPVQVRVTISGGRITDVAAIEYPNGNGRDAQINSLALPRLHDQVLSAQSAQIDGVSGATVTTNGYVASLQAALDAAHFG